MSAKAYEIMTSPSYSAKETDTVKDVIRKFVEHRISGMPIVNEKSEIVGYISDGDIMRHIGKHQDVMVDFGFFYSYIEVDQQSFDLRSKDLEQLKAMTIAKHKVIKVQADTDVEEIAALLGRKKIKKVPVERDGVLVGVISRGDVVRYIYKNYLS